MNSKFKFNDSASRETRPNSTVFWTGFPRQFDFAFLLKWINPNKIKIDSFKWIILSVSRSLSSSASFPPFSCCLSLPELITMITNFSVLCFQCCFFEQKSRFCDGKLSYCFPMIMIFLLLSLCVCARLLLSLRIRNILGPPLCLPACYSNSCSLIIWQTNHAWDSRRFSRRFKGPRRHSRDYNELVKCATLQSRAFQFEWLMIIVSGTRQVHCQSQLALRCLHFLRWRTIEDTHTWDDSETIQAGVLASSTFLLRQSYANNLAKTTCAHETAGKKEKWKVVKRRSLSMHKCLIQLHHRRAPNAGVRCVATTHSLLLLRSRDGETV